ncbi:hypothetical protein L5515_009782 [Caenorhabditis briggsae]|uniref:Nuclear receptor domain-containing protein n=1 Tax=Caenorhabditis briggsae TaxID=6238 RepID=A0AAE9F925_CAEBR|nr:hypothetical protein L5515_009782 [Caenorhabditis briggsae]
MMSQRSEKPPCSVCGEVGNGIHFGAEACRACAAFFRRSVALHKEYRCRGMGNCDILSRLEGQSEECIVLSRRIREAIQREILNYYRNNRRIEDPSMRLANLLSLLPALQRATRRFQEDVEISHVFNVYSVDEKFYEMCNGRF